MKITPIDKVGACRTGTLVGMTVKRIVEVLGFEANCKDDPYKVKHSWGFSVDIDGTNHELGIWDYKGSGKSGQFSTYGPDDIFVELFGTNYNK